MKIDLSSQRIIVTGASRGIGLAICNQLLQSGAHVIALYNTTKQSLQQLKHTFPNQLHIYQIDLRREQDVILRMKNIVSEYQINGVVLNAGIAISAPFDDDVESWLSSWKDTMKVNLDVPGLITRLILPHFRKNEGGRFLFMASRASHRGDTIEYMAYGASKAGMANLVKTIARYEGKNNIKAFGIAPGFTKTEMAQAFIDEYGEDIVLKDIALKEMTTPEDIAPTAAFFMSGMADHATGSILDINAGSYVR